MPSARRGKLKPSELRAAFQNDLAAAWKRARELHPDHTPYAFVLYGVEGTPHLMPAVLTEESLTQIGQRELDITSCYDTLAEARKDLRYCVPDSPLFSELEIPSVNALMAPHEESLDEAKGYELLAKAAMDAFTALDKEGLFGTGPKREQLLLLISTEAVEKDWSLPSARRLNPPAVYRRFEADTRVTGKYVSSEAVAVSSDGRSVYSAGMRETNPRKQLTVSEIVAYDMAGLKLKRRWNFSFPGFGDSGRAIACAPDRTVLVMRARYSGGSCETLLMRFGEKSRKVLAQTPVRGEPAAFALAHDGSRVAVIMNDKTVQVLNDKLEVLKEIKLTVGAYPVGAFRACFLRSGDLLLTTGSNGILRVDTSFDLTPAYQGNSFNLSIDEAEKLAVVSRWYRPSASGGAENMAFSVEVLELPDWKPLQTISIPGHQCVSAVISPDGSRVAFEAHEIGTYRTFISVRETATGHELARRKSLHLKALTFLPDNRTLAIAACDRTPSEPVCLWAVPDL